jgi:hypothetical protein
MLADETGLISLNTERGIRSRPYKFGINGSIGHGMAGVWKSNIKRPRATIFYFTTREISLFFKLNLI